MIGKSARNWRKTGQRGVSPIIATILLVAITVVLAAVLYILITGLTGGGNAVPLGTAWQLGTSADNTVGSNFWYNFSVEAAGNGIVVNNILYQVKTPGGSLITATSATVVAVTGCTVAVYTFSSNSWAASTAANKCTGTTGPTQASITAPYQAGEIISLLYTANLVGDTFVSVGQGHFQGTVPVTIS